MILKFENFFEVINVGVFEVVIILVLVIYIDGGIWIKK